MRMVRGRAAALLPRPLAHGGGAPGTHERWTAAWAWLDPCPCDCACAWSCLPSRCRHRRRHRRRWKPLRTSRGEAVLVRCWRRRCPAPGLALGTHRDHDAERMRQATHNGRRIRPCARAWQRPWTGPRGCGAAGRGGGADGAAIMRNVVAREGLAWDGSAAPSLTRCLRRRDTHWARCDATSRLMASPANLAAPASMTVVGGRCCG